MSSEISRNVVVTGASRGIGRAIALRLRDDGWNIFNVDISPPKTDDAITFVQADLADPGATTATLDQILLEGPVSGLVNNAGIPGEMDLLSGQTQEDMDRVYAINIRAPAVCARHLSESMQQQGFGRIVNIASRALLGKARRTAYGASKGAIASMSRVWAIELATGGVTVNTVAPGPVRTELFEAANPPDMPRTQKIIDAIPAGRIGEGEDIGHAVSFFMDDRSGFITGQTLFVCGGTMLTRGGS